MFTYSQIKAKATIIRRGMPSFSIRDAIEISIMALDNDKREAEQEAADEEETRLEARYSRAVDRWYA